MIRIGLLAIALIASTSSHPAQGAPRVTADIAPVHALVAAVTDGIAPVELLVPSGATPHGFALSPSQASMLAQTEILVWTGPGLVPWLAEKAQALRPAVAIVRLDTLPGLHLVPQRSGSRFLEDPHHGHDHHGDEHGEEPHDPHLWLDPENAKLWLTAISEALGRADPSNSDRYRRNALEAERALSDLIRNIDERLAPARGQPFVVFHDAYHAFEARFNIRAAGALSLSDATRPGAARLREVRTLIQETDTKCVFAEPQYPDALIQTVIEGSGAKRATLDPLGVAHVPGPMLYPALLNDLADALLKCLSTP